MIIGLDGTLFHDGEPIPNTAVFLNMLIKKTGVEIVYLSGRYTCLMKVTKRALEKHGYPHGRIVLRKKGEETLDFKLHELSKLRENFEIKAFITDELKELKISNLLCIPSVKVERNDEWGVNVRKRILRLSL